MTEHEFLTSDDPAAMLAWARLHNPLEAAPPSERKLRLFACACCRQVWHLVSEKYPRRCIAHAEGWADDAPYKTRCGDAASKYRGNASTGVLAKERFALAACLPDAAEAAREVMQETARSILPAQHAALLREVAGNPFRPVTLPKVRKRVAIGPFFIDAGTIDEGFSDETYCPWLTAEVLTLAQAAYDDRLPDGTLDLLRLAVLSDALEEAGCTDDAILSHLRSPGPHVRGCWALDLILGKS